MQQSFYARAAITPAESKNLSEQSPERYDSDHFDGDSPETVAPRSNDQPLRQQRVADPSFADLSLSPQVLKAVNESGYGEPTAIQAEIIPHMLDRRDVLAQSQTGTGKTAAFAMPILSKLEPTVRDPQVLVLAPTRELAIQVAKSFEIYGAFVSGLSVATLYGGQEYQPQLGQLRRGAKIVVGTPGRVIDHIRKGTLKLDKVSCLVLDEADEMLNMGFLEDVQFVLQKVPENRQIALFSATLPAPIHKIADEYLHDPAKITIKKKSMTADSIRQRALFVAPRDKIDVLKRLLEAEETDGVIVFTKTKDATVSVAQKLSREGLSAAALNGDMPQRVREQTIRQLKSGQIDILVATDVAARGLDVTRISHVFNFDLPHDSESYVHRVGRTGRAGRKGEAIILLTNAQRNKLRLIERSTKQPIEVVKPPSVAAINEIRTIRFMESISKVTAEHDLTLYKEMIQQYADDSGKPIEMIAAALAHLSQQGRPFFLREKTRKEKQKEVGHHRKRDKHKSRDASQSYGDETSSPRIDRRGRKSGPPSPGMKRYKVSVGHNDGIKPGNLVGAVANEAGIDGSCIGPIKINDSFSTIDLPEGMPHDIFQTLQVARVGGKPLRLSEWKDRAGRSEGKRSQFKKKFSHGKSRGNKKFRKRASGK